MVSVVGVAGAMRGYCMVSLGGGGGWWGGRVYPSMIVMGRCEALCQFPSEPLNFLGSGFNTM